MLDTQIASNTAAIAQNTALINGTAAASASNTSSISDNATNIATNTSNIATNASNISTNAQEISSLNDSLTNKIDSDDLNEYLLELCYPVGSIYMSENDISPAEFLGGEWEKIEEGTFIMAAGDNFTSGTTGGSNTITLDKSQIPSLDITGSTAKTTTVAVNSVGSTVATKTTAANGVGSTSSNGEHSHTVTNHVSTWLYGAVGSGSVNGYTAQGYSSNGYTSSAAGNHTHTLNIPQLTVPSTKLNLPSLTVNTATVTATYTNGNQTSIDITNKHICAYMWVRIA